MNENPDNDRLSPLHQLGLGCLVIVGVLVGLIIFGTVFDRPDFEMAPSHRRDNDPDLAQP